MAELPSEGPCRDMDDRPCQVTRNFLRPRKTGPEYAVAVLLCKTHGRSFTVYPPGHFPYGRYAVINTSPFGDTSFIKGKDTPQRCDCLFEGTLFQAGLDAAQRRAWPREGDGVSDQLWSTQVRTLSDLTRLLGVDTSLQDCERESIAASLDLDLLFLNDCGRLIETNPGYHSRGVAIKTVLERVIHKPCILDRLLLSGHMAGLWVYPLRWDVQMKVLRSPPFCRSLSRSPP